MKIFNKSQQPSNQPNRNTFDLSKQVNGTYNFGYLYPFLCQPVIPGDSFKIDMAFGLRAMPTAFPIQTKVKVFAEFFYCRNRNLWKGFQNFITKVSDSEELPYLSQSVLRSNTRTSSLGDYLGLPTTVTSNIFQENITLQSESIPLPDNSTNPLFIANVNPQTAGTNYLFAGESSITFRTTNNDYYRFLAFKVALTKALPIQQGLYYQFTFDCSKSHADYLMSKTTPYLLGYDTTTNIISLKPFNGVFGKAYSIEYTNNKLVVKFLAKFNMEDFNSSTTGNQPKPCIVFLTDSSSYLDSNILNPSTSFVKLTTSLEVDTIGNQDVPFSIVDKLPKISALPFRAYESIYNSFYRDDRNNPFLINGVFDPNRYNTNLDGGSDSTPYTLFKRNWEQDAFTSCVPSPQQGNAPLVGITSTGVAQFMDDNNNVVSVKLNTSDGDSISGIDYNTSDSNLPNYISRSAAELASSGFSISDLRGVNALQRWLEINMRRGLKYADQIQSHFGVEPKFSTLDMPEFIGGVSKIIDTNQVNNTSESPDNPLGSYAGQMSCIGSTNHTINQYCDEHGYIIGILSIVPVPVYDSVLPKDFIKREPLDFYFPEFGHIGYQPVTFAEVAPYQQLNQQDSSIYETFGYQRAWYDYLYNFDSAHGQFRTLLRDFLLCRNFTTKPTLNSQFLTVSPEHLNNIFTVTDVTDDNGNTSKVDPFLGQLHLNIIAKRPIPLHGIARLEF